MTSEDPSGTRHALVVACAEYDDSRLQKLSAPIEDANSFVTVLSDPAVGGFRVTVVVDQVSAVVSEAMEAFFADRRRQDLILLYFSGHGIKDADGRLYFAARNTRPDRLRSTGVPAAFVHDLMQQSRARSQVLVLDCCHSGAFARGMVAKSAGTVGLGERLGGRGRVVLAASDAMQYAFEGADVVGIGGAASSVFTRCLVEGLRTGAADLDGDGYITADELYDFAHQQITSQLTEQSPVMWAMDVQGDLVVARNAVVPQPGHGDVNLLQPRPTVPPVPTTKKSHWRLVLLSGVALLLSAALAAAFWPRHGGDTSGPGQRAAEVAVKVNFQSAQAPTPAGYLADFGQAFGARTGPAQGTKLTYGWVREGTHDPVNVISMGRDRNRAGIDQRRDTFVHMEGWDPALQKIQPAAWEMVVPDGRYAVTVSVGDSTRNSVNTVNVEGVRAIVAFRGTKTEDYQENTVQADVRDGRLTIDSIGGNNTKINYVEAVRLVS